jgi:queuine tRNA-ribosyltransferase
LATIHNLHYYLTLMSEMRSAIETGTFQTFVERFHADRARGVAESGGYT